jgi:hypothetical protein
MDKHAIDKAKAYSKKQNLSLSKLIENYLNSLISVEKKTKRKISPLVESLTGVIPGDNVDNYKEGYQNYLTQKYSGK